MIPAATGAAAGAGFPGRRAVTAGESLRRAAACFDRFGITRVAAITGLDRIGLPVALAFRPLSRSVVVAAGKGFDLDAAKAAAVMESIECAHAEEIAKPLLFGSPEEIARTHRIADLDALPRGPKAIGRMLWIEAQDLVRRGSAFVPYELVHAHYADPPLAGAGCFQATTNGLASGNIMAEAISHALCELIERDALTLWHLSDPAARRAREVALPSIPDATVAGLLARLERAGFRIRIWDITSDVAVPAFHCAILDATAPDGQPGTGSACHPDKSVALASAILEAVQVRAVYISGARDDIRRHEYSAAWIEKFRRAFRSYREPREMRDFEGIPHTPCATAEEETVALLDALRAAGMNEVLAVDLSRADVGIPVVRVLAPGLEGPFDEGGNFVPGRRARRLLGQ